MKPDMTSPRAAKADHDFLTRVVTRRAEEQAAKAELKGRRERDMSQITGPQSLIPVVAPRRRCLGGCGRWEHTRHYCVYCYQKIRHGRPLDGLEEEDDNG